MLSVPFTADSPKSDDLAQLGALSRRQTQVSTHERGATPIPRMRMSGYDRSTLGLGVDQPLPRRSHTGLCNIALRNGLQHLGQSIRSVCNFNAFGSPSSQHTESRVSDLHKRALYVEVMVQIGHCTCSSLNIGKSV